MAEINNRIGETNILPPAGMREIYLVGREVDERIVHPGVCQALTTFGITLTGLSEIEAGGAAFRFVRPHPRVGQVLACLGGEGRVWIGGGWVPCGQGQAYLTPAGPFHAYEAVSSSPWRLCWVIFDSSGAVADPTAALDAPHLVEVDPSPLATAIDGLYREAIGGPAAPAMLRLWAEMIRAQAARLMEPEGIDARLRRALALVEAQLDFPWSVAELARRADLSEEHVRRLCQAQLGRSPMRHVTYLRMRHAAALLSSGAYTVGAAAERVGYTNDFAFSTAFKRVMGRPPSVYRAEG